MNKSVALIGLLFFVLAGSIFLIALVLTQSPGAFDTISPLGTATPSTIAVAAPQCGVWGIASLDSLTGEHGELRGVAAVDSTDAWAVGWANENPSTNWGPMEAPANAHAVILHWDGSHWDISPATLPAISTLNSVAAISKADVWAVGTAFDGTSADSTAFAIHWDGRSWTQTTLPAYAPDKLLSVSASSPDDVWAAGVYPSSGDSPWNSWILHWNGSHWSNIPTPGPIRVTPVSGGVDDPSFVSNYSLSAVVAISSTEAWAVGTASDPMNMWYSHPAILKWDGTAWSYSSANGGSEDVSRQVGNLLGLGAYLPKAPPGGASNGPTGQVWAVGKLGDQGPPGGSLPPSTGGIIAHETGRGDNWKWLDPPCLTMTLVPCEDVTDDSITIDSLSGVAVVAGGDAWAVGQKDYSPSFGGPGEVTTALVEHWNGTDWEVVPVSVLAEQTQRLSHSSLAAVSAVPDSRGNPTNSLWAVGYLGDFDNLTPLILRFQPHTCANVSSLDER